MVLDEPDDALRAEQQAHDRQRAHQRAAGAAHAREPPQRERGDAHRGRHVPVHVDQRLQRAGAERVEPPDHVAGARAAGVRAGRGGERAGHDDQAAVDHERARRERHVAVAADPGAAAHAPDQHRAGEQQRHRQQVVRDDDRPREVERHGEPAEQALGDHAAGEHRARAAAGPAAAAARGTRARRRRCTRCRRPSRTAGCRTRSTRAMTSSGRNVPEQSGQLGQPRPEPVSRTPAPLSTISTSVASAP